MASALEKSNRLFAKPTQITTTKYQKYQFNTFSKTINLQRSNNSLSKCQKCIGKILEDTNTSKAKLKKLQNCP